MDIDGRREGGRFDRAQALGARDRPRGGGGADRGQGLGLRIAELTDALLFVELEGKGDKFHVGYWLSVYDEAQARAPDTPSKRAFRRIHESLPK